MRPLPRLRHAALAAFLVLPLAGCAVSTQQEVEMGAAYAQQVAQQLPLVRDPEVNRYLQLLGDSLARVADTRNLEWHFAIVDDPAVNAFAIPGGYIFMNRGLIESAQTMAQVAGVLGHEIGHVTQRHSIKQQQKGTATSVGVTLGCMLTGACGGATGELVNLGAGALFAKFSRSDEADADRVGVDYMIRAGLDPNGIPEMFSILLKQRERQPGLLDAWFSSHPLEESRIAETRALIDAIPAERRQGLTRDTPNFQAFKKRLASLPRSAPRR